MEPKNQTDSVQIIIDFNDKKTVNKFTKYFLKCEEIKDPEKLDVIFSYEDMTFFDILSKRKAYRNLVINFMDVLPAIKELCINYKELFKEPIKTLTTNTNGKIEITRKQAACIIALSFLGYLNYEYIQKEGDYKDKNDPKYPTYNQFDMNYVADSKGVGIQKAICFLNYLIVMGRILKNKEKYDNFLNEIITYERRNIQYNDKIYTESNTPLCPIEFDIKNSMFESKALFHIDFANKFIGGGALGLGCVQEEILFTIKPECCIALLFMEVMSKDDAILISNTLKYSDFTGYGSSFKFSYVEFDNIINNITNIEQRNQGGSFIIALDAIPFRSQNGFKAETIIRDIHKSYVGFSFIDHIEDKNKRVISTGNWGCGAFGGDYELKLLEQWMAASAAGVEKIEYFTFGDKHMLNAIKKYEKIKEKFKTVAELNKVLTNNEHFQKGRVIEIIETISK